MFLQVLGLGSPGIKGPTQQVHDFVEEVELVDRGEEGHALVDLPHHAREGPDVGLELASLPGSCTAGSRRSFPGT